MKNKKKSTLLIYKGKLFCPAAHTNIDKIINIIIACIVILIIIDVVIHSLLIYWIFNNSKTSTKILFFLTH